MWITPTILSLGSRQQIIPQQDEWMLYVSSHNLFFPLNHRQQTCLTLRKEGTPANKPPGNWMSMEGGRISKCAYTTRTHAGSTLFLRTTVPHCLQRSLRVEMGLEKCLSTKHFTADQRTHIQTFNSVIYRLPKKRLCCEFCTCALTRTTLFIVLCTLPHVTEICLRHTNVILWWSIILLL